MDKFLHPTIIKRKLAPHLPVLGKVAAAISLIIFVLIIFKAVSLLTPSLKYWWSVRQAALSLLKSPQSILTHTNGRTNFLILGKGGAGHEAPDLTDTIMVASYHYQTQSTILLSLPRDLWIDSLKAKINTAYYYGNQKKPGGGLILAKAAVEEVIDQPIHYVAIVDFNGFIKLVDLIGGVEIAIPQTFDDYKYPIPGKENAQPESSRYEHLHFEQGTAIMDGTKALKYVRSRNAEGDQGTDYARSQRQQQLIVALQQKLLSTNTLLKPQKLSGLLDLASKSLETNAPPETIPALVKLAIQFDRSKLTSAALDQGDKDTGKDGLLINPSPSQYQGQWVLTGKDKSWKEVHTYIDHLFSP